MLSLWKLSLSFSRRLRSDITWCNWLLVVVFVPSTCSRSQFILLRKQIEPFIIFCPLKLISLSSSLGAKTGSKGVNARLLELVCSPKTSPAGLDITDGEDTADDDEVVVVEEMTAIIAFMIAASSRSAGNCTSCCWLFICLQGKMPSIFGEICRSNK